MSNFSKEGLRNYVKEQNFKSPDDVPAAIKEMFIDVLQEVLEAEMDTQLGYDWYDTSENNYKINYSFISISQFIKLMKINKKQAAYCKYFI